MIPLRKKHYNLYAFEQSFQKEEKLILECLQFSENHALLYISKFVRSAPTIEPSGRWDSPEEESNKKSNDSAPYLHTHQPPAYHSHIYHVNVSHALTTSTRVIATLGLPKRQPLTQRLLQQIA